MSKQKLKNSKVAIIGSGFVGASIAYALTLRNLSREIVLIDEQKEKALGEALDIQHGISFIGIRNVYVGGWRDCVDCSLIIICAGRGRRPGEPSLPSIISVNGVEKRLEEHWSDSEIERLKCSAEKLTYLFNDLL